jgi:energy-coupling factor transporter transmembrane protein EcfT
MSAPDRSVWTAPVLLGVLAGALVAARFETALGCIAIVLLVAPRGAGGGRFGRGWALVASGVAISIGLNLYLVNGRPIAALPVVFGRSATFEGLAAGALLSLRVIGATLAVRGLAALWPGERAADELARLLRPLARFGVPVAEARTVAALAVRFQPLLAEEAARIGRLQELRAGRPPRNAAERVERTRARLVPVMVGSLERAEQVAMALEARHYRLRPIEPGPGSPWAARLAGIAIAVVALVWRG